MEIIDTVVFFLVTGCLLMEIFLFQQILYKRALGQVYDQLIEGLKESRKDKLMYFGGGSLFLAPIAYFLSPTTTAIYVIFVAMQLLNLWIRYSQIEESNDGYVD